MVYFQIFLISLYFSLIVGSGFYGFGHDFYAGYYQPNLKIGAFRDQIGFMLSTLTIYKFHVGVYLTSFLLSLSVGLLLFKTFYGYFYKNKSLFFIIFLMLIHTWPVIMATSNSMRQGLSMSFLFCILCSN